jgi:hypothetical protein
MNKKTEYKNVKEEFILAAKKIAAAHVGFTSGCRVLFLINRHVDDTKLRAYIVRNDEEWIMALGKLLQEQADYKSLPRLRIYQSLNSRNIEKGIMHFKHMQLDADYYDTESRQSFYLDVRNRIVSAFMKPPSAAESYFLYDCDTKVESILTPFREELLKHTKIAHEYPSMSGVHIITEPFNPNDVKVPPLIEFKKDALMLLAF